MGRTNIGGGINTKDATAIASDILSGKTAYTGKDKLTGTMPNNGALSYTPTTSQQTIPAGYTSGGTVSGVTSEIDSNIKATNIKTGTSILDVSGTFTADATATASDIQSGKIAYVNGSKVTGTSEAIDINGIIEQYKITAGENVNAGDFVAFIEKGAKEDTELTSLGYYISAVALSENKVFIAHGGQINCPELYRNSLYNIRNNNNSWNRYTIKYS